MWFCDSKQKVQSNNLTIKNIFTLFSVWFPEVPWKAKNVKNNKPAAILKLAFVPSIRTSSCNRAGLHSNRTAQLNSVTAQLNSVTAQLNSVTAQLNRTTELRNSTTEQLNSVTAQLNN